MIRLAVKLRESIFCCGVHTSQNALQNVNLGCKGSWVQIPPIRPFYLYVITQFSEYYWRLSKDIIPAYICSKTQTKAGDTGGKIERLPVSGFHSSLSALISSLPHSFFITKNFSTLKASGDGYGAF